jgi:hypothetical protein
MVPVWRITPGAAITAAMWAEPLAPQRRGQDAHAVDPVLHGDDPGRGTDQRPGGCRRLLGVVELDREDHQIDRADGGRIVGRLRRLHGGVAECALDPEPLAPQGREVRAAGDEGNVLAAGREPAADIAADPAAAHDRDPHRRHPLRPSASIPHWRAMPGRHATTRAGKASSPRATGCRAS